MPDPRTDPLTDMTRRSLINAGQATADAAGPSLTTAIRVRRLLESRRQELEALGVAVDDVLLNALEFVLLLQFDIGTLMSAFGRTTGTLGGNLYARLLLLTVHESALTLQSVLARTFREAIVRRLGRPELDAILRTVHSDIVQFYRRVEAQYGDVRDGILAHRDPNAEVRATLLERTEQEAVAVLSSDFLEILQRIGPILGQFTEALLADLERVERGAV